MFWGVSKSLPLSFFCVITLFFWAVFSNPRGTCANWEPTWGDCGAIKKAFFWAVRVFPRGSSFADSRVWRLFRPVRYCTSKDPTLRIDCQIDYKGIGALLFGVGVDDRVEESMVPRSPQRPSGFIPNLDSTKTHLFTQPDLFFSQATAERQKAQAGERAAGFPG